MRMMVRRLSVGGILIRCSRSLEQSVRLVNMAGGSVITAFKSTLEGRLLTNMRVIPPVGSLWCCSAAADRRGRGGR